MEGLGIDRNYLLAEIVRLQITELAPSANPVIGLIREVDIQLRMPTAWALIARDLLQH